MTRCHASTRIPTLLILNSPVVASGGRAGSGIRRDMGGALVVFSTRARVRPPRSSGGGLVVFEVVLILLSFPRPPGPWPWQINRNSLENYSAAGAPTAPRAQQKSNRETQGAVCRSREATSSSQYNTETTAHTHRSMTEVRMAIRATPPCPLSLPPTPFCCSLSLSLSLSFSLFSSL